MHPQGGVTAAAIVRGRIVSLHLVNRSVSPLPTIMRRRRALTSHAQAI